jgi:hypothetical protein
MCERDEKTNVMRSEEKKDRNLRLKVNIDFLSIMLEKEAFLIRERSFLFNALSK